MKRFITYNLKQNTSHDLVKYYIISGCEVIFHKIEVQILLKTRGSYKEEIAGGDERRRWCSLIISIFSSCIYIDHYKNTALFIYDSFVKEVLHRYLFCMM